MKRFVVVAALAVTGCAHGLVPPGVSGNEMFVSVSNVWNESQALPLANTHCASFGKVPRFTKMEGYRAIFDCVART